MANTTLRLISDRYRNKGPGNPVRHGLAIVFTIASLVAAYYVFSRDVNWENRAREARQLGITAYHNGNFELARDYYEVALANHPYDYATHRNLADLLFRRLNDPDGALRHYLYSMAFSPMPGEDKEAVDAVGVIRLLRSGELENPHDALGDMFQTVEAGAMAAFMRRLSTDLREDRQAYWDAWRARGRGTVTRMLITSNSNGFYDAFVELYFADDTAMSMHLMCPLRDIWRLELSFP